MKRGIIVDSSNGEYIKTATVNGKLVEIVRFAKQGGGHIKVVVRKLTPVKDGKTGTVCGYTRGKNVEAFGGFKREKDFNQAIALNVAIENAVSHIK